MKAGFPFTYVTLQVTPSFYLHIRIRKTAIAVRIAMSNNAHFPIVLSDAAIRTTPDAKITIKRVRANHGIY